METSQEKFKALLEKAGKLFRSGAPLDAASLLWGELDHSLEHLQGWALLSDLELELARPEKAVEAARKAQQLAPNDPKILFALAAALRALGNNVEAAEHFDAVSKAFPQSAAVWSNLGNAQADLGRLDDAVKSYNKALEIKSDFVEARTNLGLVLIAKGMPKTAEAEFEAVLEQDLQSLPAQLNLGGLALAAGQKELALERFDAVLKIDPSNHVALYNRGCVLGQLGEFAGAEAALKQVLAQTPDDGDAQAQLFHVLQKTCAWDELVAVKANLETLTSASLKNDARPGETPFMSIARSADPERNFLIARAWSSEMVSRLKPLQTKFNFPEPKKQNERLKIAYLSGNFYDHPTAHNTAGLFARHDRDHFEVCAYSFGPNDESPHRQMIESESDDFVDISELGDGEAAQKINADGVDILIGLTGHTDGSRLEICALRPAPIQVGYLTFPGTCGGDFLDYILVDERVSPPDEMQFYSEAPAYLPGTYWPTNNNQVVAQKPSRASQGLPEEGFVFSCFNQAYKIDREVFTCWMKLLQRVPESVLWLFRSNREAEANLKTEAEKAGIDPARLIFADKLSKPEHLARISLADLGLDTQVYTGHTTTTDALWAGVPVVALEGRHFASRVSASLLAADELEDLIVPDLKTYEQLALDIAQNPDRLQALKGRVEVNRSTSLLFDTVAKVKALEGLYQSMWARYCNGEAPTVLGGNSRG